MIELSVDNSVNAAYMKLTNETIVRTVHVAPNVLIDYDANGNIVGIEHLLVNHQSQEQLEEIFKDDKNIKVRVTD